MTVPPALGTLATWRLSRASARAHRILQARLAAAGRTGYEYRVLAAVVAAPGLSQADVGRAAGLDPRDVTHTVRDLEGQGLVVRSPDPARGRVLLVAPTSAGRELWQDVHALMLEIQDEVLGPLDEQERRTLLELLGRLADPPRPSA